VAKLTGSPLGPPTPSGKPSQRDKLSEGRAGEKNHFPNSGPLRCQSREGREKIHAKKKNSSCLLSKRGGKRASFSPFHGGGSSAEVHRKNFYLINLLKKKGGESGRKSQGRTLNRCAWQSLPKSLRGRGSCEPIEKKEKRESRVEEKVRAVCGREKKKNPRSFYC